MSNKNQDQDTNSLKYSTNTSNADRGYPSDSYIPLKSPQSSQRSQYNNNSSKTHSNSSKTQNSILEISNITKSDIEEKYKSLRIQNKELKEILLKKEAEINSLKKKKIKYNEDLKILNDPLSSKPLLKKMYKEKLAEKDFKIKELKKNVYNAKNKGWQLEKNIKALKKDIMYVDSNNSKKMYEEKLELEERSRREMQIYAWELAIKHANCEGNETNQKLKSEAESYLNEHKALKDQLESAEKEGFASELQKKLKQKIEQLESKYS